MSWLFALIAIGALFSGCGNYSSTTRAAREEFYAGKFSDAAKALEKGAHEEGLDQLLYLFDRATALHQAGEYEESNKDFHLADKLSEVKDYTSLSAEAATLLTNDKIIPYKGEDFEKVLISQYLALNYLMLRKLEDALVECRRVNHKLQMMISQGKRKYKLNPMAHYVAAMMYEDQREWNDAYVDYQAVYKLMPEFPYLREDLYRLAWRNRISDEVIGTAHWAQTFGLSAEVQKKIRTSAEEPEIVVLIENGRSPEKHPHRMWSALPQYIARDNPISYAEVSVNGVKQGQTQRLFDIEQTAISNLDEKYAGLLAKRIGGVVAKEVIADQVGRRTDPIFGQILRIGMHAMDQADLRSWLTLPKDFQIFRVRVSGAGSYSVRIMPVTAGGISYPSSAPSLEKIVHFEDAKKGQRAFLHFRVF